MTSASACSFINSTRYCSRGFYLTCTSYWMLRYSKEILQYFQHSFHSQDFSIVPETSTGQNHKVYVDVVPKIILKFSIVEVSFQKKKFWICIPWYLFLFVKVDVLMRLLSIEQIIKDTNICFMFRYHSLIVIHFMNGEGVC